MRNGIKVYDCDTHLRPTVETIVPYLDPQRRAEAAEWRKVPVRVGMAGERFEAWRAQRAVARQAQVEYWRRGGAIATLLRRKIALRGVADGDRLLAHE
jgi:hypothetical protein